MAESNFVDYVKIYCRSGKGGRGSSHFRREIHSERRSDAGGDGGEKEVMCISVVTGIAGRSFT